MIEKLISETEPALEFEFRNELIKIRIDGKEVMRAVFDPKISDMFHEALARWSKKYSGKQ